MNKTKIKNTSTQKRRGRKILAETNPEKITELKNLRQSGKTYAEIGLLLNCSKQAIQQICAKYNIKKPSRFDVDTIKNLRASGKSLGDISKELNCCISTISDLCTKHYIPRSKKSPKYKTDVSLVKEMRQSGKTYAEIAKATNRHIVTIQKLCVRNNIYPNNTNYRSDATRLFNSTLKGLRKSLELRLAHRERVINIINNIKNTHGKLSYAAIASKLNDTGLRKRNGTAWNTNDVWQLLNKTPKSLQKIASKDTNHETINTIEHYRDNEEAIVEARTKEDFVSVSKDIETLKRPSLFSRIGAIFSSILPL